MNHTIRFLAISICHERKTKEAWFAHQCDKLECDLQAKLYSEANLVDLKKQDDNNSFFDPRVQKLLKDSTWGEMWIKFGQNNYNYDDEFLAVSNYALNNEITNNEQEKD